MPQNNRNKQNERKSFKLPDNCTVRYEMNSTYLIFKKVVEIDESKSRKRVKVGKRERVDEFEEERKVLKIAKIEQNEGKAS